MKKFWIVFAVIAVVVGGGMISLYMVVRNFDAQPPVQGGTLVWRVDGDYVERRETNLVSLAMGDMAPTFPEVVFAVERAARDPRIDSLLLDIRSVPMTWSKIDELREAIGRFAATGKPVTACIAQAGSREYVLATVADRIVMAPEANLMVVGISAELAFMKDTLSKIGMQADFVHVGRYKSAPERMTRSGASDANLEMMETIIGELYEQMVVAIAAGRELPAEDVRTCIDTGIFDAGRALASGLVDEASVFEAARRNFVGDGEETAFADYLLDRGDEHTVGTIALVNVAGTIMPGASTDSGWQGLIAGSDTVVEQLADAGDDETVDAILLRVDSPGGSAMASDLIWNEIERVRELKPVVVSMGGYAASGGYYVSCGADSIFADPGTLTGSIGVYAGKLDRAGFYDKIGVKREFITRGENARFFGDDATFSSRQREHLQGLLDDFYGRFVAKVAAGRELGTDQVHEIAQGRVWTGSQALRNGLVDAEGGLVRAFRAARRLAELPEEGRIAVRSYERQLTFMERFILRSLHNASVTEVETLMAIPVELLAEDGIFAAVELMDGRPVAMMPVRVHFRP